MLGETNATLEIEGVYEQLVNYLMLYDYGDECTNVTGGWTGGYQDNYSSGGYSKQSTYLRTYETSTSSYGNTAFVTAKPISNVEYPRIAMFYTLASYRIPNTSYPVEAKVQLMKTSSTKNADKYTGAQINYKHTSTGTFSVTKMTAVIGNTFLNPNTQENVYPSVASGSGALSGFTIDMYSYRVTAFKRDNWQELCKIAGLDPNSYTDESTLCADSSAITTILNNKNAIEFMIKQCTGSFMGQFVATDTCLTALSNSEFNTLVLANEHWNKFLSIMS